jgi:hypothetical protein
VWAELRRIPAGETRSYGALAAALGLRLFERDLLPASCRWCSPGRFDAWAHETLAWEHPSRAATASDLLGVGVPIGAAAALAVPDLAAGAPRRAADDALLVAEAVSIATLGTELVKVGTDRIRPDAWGRERARARARLARLLLVGPHRDGVRGGGRGRHHRHPARGAGRAVDRRRRRRGGERGGLPAAGGGPPLGDRRAGRRGLGHGGRGPGAAAPPAPDRARAPGAGAGRDRRRVLAQPS